jgi:hypothetical protein
VWRPGGGRSKLTYRMLGLYIDGLSAASLTKTAMRNEHADSDLAAASTEQHEHGPWSHTDLLLAELWDLIAGLMHDSKKGDPPRYPRPGVGKPGESGRKGRMSPAQMRLYLEKRQIGGTASDDSA